MNIRTLLLVISGFLIFATTTFSQESEPAKPTGKKLQVGVSIFPPLVIESNDGLTGFDIDLWKAIASRLDLEFEFKVFDFKKLLAAVEDGSVDLAVAGISITAEREDSVDFSHHYMDSGLAVAVSGENSVNILTALFTLLKKSTFMLILGFLGFTIICSHLLWFSERGSTAIDDSYAPGICDAIWCTLATATTVGYGDVVPRKMLGRIAALFVMMAGIGFFGILSAELMSTLTTLRLGSDIENFSDLKGKRVATVSGTTSIAALQEVKAKITTTADVEEAYELLRKKKVQAVVYDMPALKYHAAHAGSGEVFVTGSIFEAQYYGIALGRQSEYREAINKVLLNLRADGTYDRLYRSWFGVEEK